MGTKENVLEPLRKKYGCTLSQAQIESKMGFSSDASGRSGYRVSKFETKTTKSLDVVNFFRYCYVTNLDCDLVFTTLYPDEPYSKQYLETIKKENAMVESKNTPKITQEKKSLKSTALSAILNKWKAEDPHSKLRETVIRHLSSDCPSVSQRYIDSDPRIHSLKSISKNTCLIGNHRTAKKRAFILPEILSAMQEDKNVFAIIDDKDGIDVIFNYAAETGHKVYVSDYFKNAINWFSSIDEPESIHMFVRSLAKVRHYDDDDPWSQTFNDVAECICRRFFWNDTFKNNDDSQHIKNMIEWLSALTIEDVSSFTKHNYSDRLLSSLLSELGVALCEIGYNEYWDAKNLDDIIINNEKHVILYIMNGVYNPVPSFALEQYMRLLNNVKSWSDELRGIERSFEIIIDDFPQNCNSPFNSMEKWFVISNLRNIPILIVFSSIEQLKDTFPDNWENIMKRFPSIYLLGITDSLCSFNTEDYLARRIGETSISLYMDKPEDCSDLGLIDWNEVKMLDPLTTLHIEDGKSPDFIRFVIQDKPEADLSEALQEHEGDSL